MARLYLLLLFVSLLHSQQTVSILDTSDATSQPSLVWFPTGVSGNIPLLVHLHSWSSHYDSSDAWRIALAEAQKRNWAFVAR